MGVPTVYVQDHTFIFGPGLNFGACPIYLSVGDDKLFALDFSVFEVLRKLGHNGPWKWNELSYPPFLRLDVYSYDVQPDGSILVSTRSDTFIFDTKEYVWKLYGGWAFPFTGHGYYDTSLDGFVGLSKDSEKLGYLYCCNMANTMADDTGKRLHPSPDIKCTKENLYTKNLAERHVSATLLHMRPGRFCLVECVCIDSGMTDQKLREPYVNPKFMERGFEGGGPQSCRET
nr:unnamed protein product [Digitaria exilis]